MTTMNKVSSKPVKINVPLLTTTQRRLLRQLIIHLVLLSGVFFMLIPLIWSISSSLKSAGDVYALPPKWIPNPIHWENYAEAVTAIPFWRYLWNTTFITLVSIVGKVFSVTLVAFAFARLEWWGRDFFFVVMLATMMLPPHVTLIPQFILFKYLGWIDTFLPLIVPQFFGGPYLTFLARQFFMTLPRDLDDAARIDGCSNFGVFWRVILPMSKPVIAMIVVIVFNNQWNEFLNALIYLQNSKNFTLALGLRMFQGEAAASWHLLMAASILTMLPVLVLFFSAQKYFMQGIVFTGVKQ
ncbi:MAG TPA: carbohydrate ABC transporter permease [Anaerolineaceae bacterium]